MNGQEVNRMNDLISRQAAIDCLGFTWPEDAIRNLPSAQPDIIRCPDCYYNDGTAYCELHFRNVKAKDFCSWAERRE